jgi:voltage-gated potassium channel
LYPPSVPHSSAAWGRAAPIIPSSMQPTQTHDDDLTRERLGAFIHHPVMNLAIVVLILASVGMVFAHLLLPPDHYFQDPIEHVQNLVTIVFVLELGIKYYVAPDKARYFGQYWIDLIAIIPWAQSLRILRILRLLRVFRAAVILSRRVRFVSALFRSAIGEYIVLAMIMGIFLIVGSFTLWRTEERARVERLAELREELTPEEYELAVAREGPDAELLADPENALWATIYFLVATEPMIAVPRTTMGRAIVLVVMFGGLTTFAIFTGIVTALMVNRLKRRMEIDDMDRYQLNDHIVICGWNRLVPLLLEEFQEAPRDSPAIVIVAELEEPPAEIRNLDVSARVFFVRGDYTRPEVLEQARIKQASRAIIVADDTIERGDQDRDARTVLASLMIEHMQPTMYTCAELLNRDNEEHLRAAGIEEVIVTSEAGGHHLAMAAMHAGLSRVIHELMTVKVGNHLDKVAVPEELVGKTFMDALHLFKREKGALVVAVETNGQDGHHVEGYDIVVNPGPDHPLAARDNLVLIDAPGKNKGK